MPIVMRTEPVGGRAVINAALSQRTHRTAALSILGGAPRTGAPLPLYNLGLDDLSSADPFSHANLVGWRYPVVGGEAPGLAHLSAGTGTPEYEGLSHGVLAQRLLDAAALAETSFGETGEQYEARLLQIPALRIVALWMAGPSNRFITLLDGRSPEGPPLRVVDDISPVIATARAPLGGAAPTPGPGPTN
jgi:hypothetical protein